MLPVVSSEARTRDSSCSFDLNENPYAPVAESAEDFFEGRIDVAGFTERPRTLFPFLTKLEVTHPKVEGDSSTTSVIVLDLDEVAATAAGSDSGGSVIGESLLLSGAGFLALWYGTKASIEKIIETTGEIEDLKGEKAALLEALSDLGSQTTSSESANRFTKNIEAILIENKIHRRSAKVERLFSGVISGVGATGIAAGTFMKVPLYATVTSSAIGGVVLAAAAPVISVFALGIAGQQAHRFYKAHSLAPKIDKLIELSKSKSEKEVYGLLQERIDLIRKVSAVRGVSMTCLAIGAPLTVFSGPYGLAVLLPGVFAGIIASYIDTKKITYAPQLDWQEKAQIDGKDALINAIQSAHNEYALLKSLKSDLRLLYPIGYEAPQPFKFLARTSALIRRKLDEDYIEVRPEQTFLQYLSGHLPLQIESLQKTTANIRSELETLLANNPDRTLWSEDQNLREQELLEKISSCMAEISELEQERRLLEQQVNFASPSTDQSMFLILGHLVRNRLFPSFSELILKDRKLKKILIQKGVLTKDKQEYHVDANKLVLMFVSGNEPSSNDLGIAKNLFEKARATLLTTAKNRAHWRERQLLDFLAVHLTTSPQSF